EVDRVPLRRELPEPEHRGIAHLLGDPEVFLTVAIQRFEMAQLAVDQRLTPRLDVLEPRCELSLSVGHEPRAELPELRVLAPRGRDAILELLGDADELLAVDV